MPSIVQHSTTAQSSSGLADATFDTSMQPVVEALTQFGVKIGDDCMAIGTEWLTFLSRRLQSDIDLPVRLAGCGCPDAVMQAWSDFFSRAAQDYQHEFERLTNLSMQLQRDAATPPQLS